MADQTKKTLAALERVFAAEIEGRLPFQSKEKIFTDLSEQGLLERVNRTFGAGHMFPARVWGYELTHLGHITYCESCKEIDDAPT